MYSILCILLYILRVPGTQISTPIWYINPTTISLLLHMIQGSSHLLWKSLCLPNLSCFFGVLDKIAALRYVHTLILKAFHNAILSKIALRVRDYKHCYTPIQAGAIQSDQKPFLDYREPERRQPERSWTSFVVLEAPRPGNAVPHKDEKRQSSKASICAPVSRGHGQTDIFIMGQCHPRQASDPQAWKTLSLLLSLWWSVTQASTEKDQRGHRGLA